MIVYVPHLLGLGFPTQNKTRPHSQETFKDTAGHFHNARLQGLSFLRFIFENLTTLISRPRVKLHLSSPEKENHHYILTLILSQTCMLAISSSAHKQTENLFHNAKVTMSVKLQSKIYPLIICFGAHLHNMMCMRWTGCLFLTHSYRMVYSKHHFFLNILLYLCCFL